MVVVVVVVDGLVGLDGLKVVGGRVGFSDHAGSSGRNGSTGCGASSSGSAGMICDVPEPGAAKTVRIVESRGCLPSPHLNICV